MMGLDAAAPRLPIVLLVDPVVASRYWMWRTLSRAFGVLEAASAGAAREWIAQRPDIDAIVVQRMLPDAPGAELVMELERAQHPVARRAIVVERGDLRSAIAKLVGWFITRDKGLARAVLREVERMSA